MTSRQLRRAEEHKARKAAYQAARQGNSVSGSEPPNPFPQEHIAEQTTKAPAPELQAVKVCTGQTMLLPAAAYRVLVAGFFSRLNPEGARESEIVQSLADLQWRLNRIPNLEQGLYAYGRVQYAKLFAEHDHADLRASLIDSHTLITHAKQFSNLAAQELRLFRYFSQYRAELYQVQEQRRRLARMAEEEEESCSMSTAAPRRLSATSGSIGFEFSSGENHFPSLPDFQIPLFVSPIKSASASQER